MGQIRRQVKESQLLWAVIKQRILLFCRAIRRRKILPLQSRTEFPKNCIGRPQPVSTVNSFLASFVLSGNPWKCLNPDLDQQLQYFQK